MFDCWRRIIFRHCLPRPRCWSRRQFCRGGHAAVRAFPLFIATISLGVADPSLSAGRSGRPAAPSYSVSFRKPAAAFRNYTEAAMWYTPLPDHGDASHILARSALRQGQVGRAADLRSRPKMAEPVRPRPRRGGAREARGNASPRRDHQIRAGEVARRRCARLEWERIRGSGDRFRVPTRCKIASSESVPPPSGTIPNAEFVTAPALQRTTPRMAARWRCDVRATRADLQFEQS